MSWLNQLTEKGSVLSYPKGHAGNICIFAWNMPLQSIQHTMICVLTFHNEIKVIYITPSVFIHLNWSLLYLFTFCISHNVVILVVYLLSTLTIFNKCHGNLSNSYGDTLLKTKQKGQPHGAPGDHQSLELVLLGPAKQRRRLMSRLDFERPVNAFISSSFLEKNHIESQ